MTPQEKRDLYTIRALGNIKQAIDNLQEAGFDDISHAIDRLRAMHLFLLNKSLEIYTRLSLEEIVSLSIKEQMEKKNLAEMELD